MTSRRKRERDNEPDQHGKRQRRRQRSRSEPVVKDSNSTEKRQALKRLFGRMCSEGMENGHHTSDDLHHDPGYEQDNTSYEQDNTGYDQDNTDNEQNTYGDENDDPLLEFVPVNMLPEELGYFLCAQETLRFLHGGGIPIGHPMFSRLRTRLLRVFGEIAMA